MTSFAKKSGGTARRGFLALFTGTASGQAIAILATPIISRIYGPESYGIYSVILSLAAVVTPVATLRLESAALLPRSEDDVRHLVRAGITSAVLVSVCTGFAIWLLELLGVNLGLANVTWGPAWISILIFVTGAFSLLSQVAIRRKQFANVAKRSVTQQGGTALSQGLLSFASTSFAGLTGGRILGLLCGYIPLLRANWDVLAKPRGGSWRSLLRTYWRFPAVFAPSALLNAAGSQLPVLLISTTFGAAVAGHLGMTQRLVFVPATLIGAAVGQVFAAEMSSRIREQRTGATQLFLKLSLWLALGGLGLALALIWVSPPLFEIILGSQWEQSGVFAQSMAVSVGIGFVASPLSKVYGLFQRAGASIAIDLSRVIFLGIATLIALSYDFSAVQTVFALYMSQALNYVLTWTTALWIVRDYERKMANADLSPPADL